MAEIVNLNRARKDRAKTEATSQAKANRVLHGLTKDQRDAARAERERLSRLLDQTRRED
ncbi:DUF4169 family protein [Brevundimonas subvibrioides]|uniref:DUF4169 domain-containing protein n=1 Tax=Brevundimonas subvibrioides (strain ATCC 15264 / DSM 4735 / LMG 14903 / NBRC 16000 / CB 81) TaxID=633149 RepID=D9QJA6_BRESC|nr:DUF4169 family protein [Brevundimonas subvibrioides]ADL01467.1 conserved hypothetical protein [Brevundimonas subvibrioides ATCC 15264]